LVKEDVTIVANNAVDIVQSVSEAGTSITVAQLVLLLRGSKSTKRGLEDLIGAGNCKHLSKELVELALDQLLVSDILTTRREQGQRGYTVEYVEVGVSFVHSKANMLKCFSWVHLEHHSSPEENVSRSSGGLPRLGSQNHQSKNAKGKGNIGRRKSMAMIPSNLFPKRKTYKVWLPLRDRPLSVLGKGTLAPT
jgi:hypothetical protein